MRLSVGGAPAGPVRSRRSAFPFGGIVSTPGPDRPIIQRADTVAAGGGSRAFLARLSNGAGQPVGRSVRPAGSSAQSTGVMVPVSQSARKIA